MIRLKNIERLGNIIKADAYPEDCKIAVKFVLHIDTKELETYSLLEEYKYCSGHMAKAKWFLLDLIKKNEPIPEERLIMWY